MPKVTVLAMNCDTLAARVALAINGEPTHSFANRAEIKDSTLRSILGGSQPGVDKLVAIAKTAGVSLEWLATGEGEMRLGAGEPRLNMITRATPPAESQQRVGVVVAKTPEPNDNDDWWPDLNSQSAAEPYSSAELPADAVSPPKSDARLIGRLTEKILAVYKEMGQAIAVHQAVELAAKEHDRLVREVVDPDERLIQIGEITAALRQELRVSETDPASSKRRA